MDAINYTDPDMPGAVVTPETAERLVSLAKAAVEAFDVADRRAIDAEADRHVARIAAARAMRATNHAGVTQNEIGEAVGKSQAWVSAMIAWADSGIDKPFAEPSKAARARRQVETDDGDDGDDGGGDGDDGGGEETTGYSDNRAEPTAAQKVNAAIDKFWPDMEPAEQLTLFEKVKKLKDAMLRGTKIGAAA